jgi:hypothetical protein
MSRRRVALFVHDREDYNLAHIFLGVSGKLRLFPHDGLGRNHSVTNYPRTFF